MMLKKTVLVRKERSCKAGCYKRDASQINKRTRMKVEYLLKDECDE